MKCTRKMNQAFLKLLFIFVTAHFFLAQCSTAPDFTDPLVRKNFLADLRERNTRILNDLHQGRCKKALSALGLDDHSAKTNRRSSLAGLYLKGLCVKRDPVLAADLLNQALDEYPRSSWALARLGALYWTGDGIKQDQTMARQLFRRAVVALGPRDPKPNDYWPQTTHFYWHLSLKEMSRRFYHNLTGPWNIPDPLQEELDWLIEAESIGGARILEISSHLRDGTGGFEQDEVEAYRWVEAASLYYDYLPAAYSYFHLAKSQGENLFAPFYDLVELAYAGDMRAQKDVLATLENGADYPRRNWALYYWMLRLKKNGAAIDEQRLKQICTQLKPDECHIIENWDKRTSGIKPISPPFTFFHKKS